MQMLQWGNGLLLALDFIQTLQLEFFVLNLEEKGWNLPCKGTTSEQQCCGEGRTKRNGCLIVAK